MTRATATLLGAALISLGPWLRGADSTANQPPEPPATAIRLNSLGYLPDSPKRATVAGTSSVPFRVIRVPAGSTVYTGNLPAPVAVANSTDSLTLADFSAVREPGEFQLEIDGLGRSAPFRIDPDLYAPAFRTVTRAMYLWRCGTAVSGSHEGFTFSHGTCHTNDAWLDLVSGKHERQISNGGWHDAGDYNKYVVNAGITVGSMLRAWEDFGPAIRKVSLNLPPTASGTSLAHDKTPPPLPEFLAEVKWELDWLLTMQAPDGSVYHKLSTRKFGGMILPEKESTERFLSPWSSAATADFVATLSQAARCFRPHDEVYASRCLDAARRSLEFLRAHPEDHRADLSAFTTGPYQTVDADDRLWASAEFWATTGDSTALADAESRLATLEARVDIDFDWGNVRNLGVLTYLRSDQPGRNEGLHQRLRANLVAAADAILRTRDAHPYARPLGDRYYWGCNGSVARQTLVLETAFRLTREGRYHQAGLDALNHLFGRNAHGRSYVTGLGFQPPKHPHDRRSAGDNVEAPWPGYLIGGPHPKATDWYDREDDYRTNEIAINWNGALIYALAAFLPRADR
jgi:endoglucanase